MHRFEQQWTLQGPVSPVTEALQYTRASFVSGLLTGLLLGCVGVFLTHQIRVEPVRPTGPIGDLPAVAGAPPCGTVVRPPTRPGE